MSARYFAYGSNLSPQRMQGRVAGATAWGVARLPGYRLTWDKRGADGTGKANLRSDASAWVWGVVYAFDADRWPDLDAHERGYARIPVQLELCGTVLAAETYLSTQRTTAAPLASYRRLVLAGARAHQLPQDWLRLLEAVATQQDEPAG